MMDSGVMSSSATGQAGRGQRLTTAEEAARYAPYHALVERVTELDAYSHQVLHQFPKLERHLLCAEIRAGMNELDRLLVVAWKRRQKSAALFDLDVAVELLRHRVRKSYRLGYINARRCDVWMRHIDEIGRMVGAWIKHDGARP